MAIIAKVKKTVVLNAGGTVLIDPTDPYDQYTDYQFTGTGDLLANYAIAPTGTIAHSYKVRIIWAATMGLNGNTVTIFSKVLSAQQAGSGAVVIEALYNMVTSSWIVTVMDSTTFGPQTYEGSDNHVLDVAGGVLTLVPGTDKKYQYITGTGAMTGNWSITGGGTPKDGDEFFIHYNGTFTAGANTFTIFGISLTAGEILAGDIGVIVYYNATTASWLAKFIAAQ